MFYFIVYKDRLSNRFEICKVIDEHPVKWYNKNRYRKAPGFHPKPPIEIVLLNWKQISEEEFNMWGEE